MKRALHLTSWYIEDGEYRVQSRNRGCSTFLSDEGLTLAARSIGGGHLTIWVFYGDVIELRRLMKRAQRAGGAA